MRRLIAYISVTTALIAGMALSFLEVSQKISSNLEFSDGKQFVYRMIDKDNPDAVIPEGAVIDMANTMQDRLEQASVTKYDIDVEGKNQIRVTIAQDTANQYERIRRYLNFDGTFTLATSKNTMVVDDEMFLNSVARVDYKGQFPFVIIPLSNPDYFAEHIVKEAQQIANEAPNNEQSNEIPKEAYIQLWANRTEEDSYEESLTNVEMAEKIILQFDPNNLYWEEGETNEIAAAINLYQFGSPDSNNYFSPTIVKQANEIAYYFVNLFNASALNYKVEYLFTQNVPASIENILNLGSNLTASWSKTLISSLIVGVILILILAYFYHLPSVAIVLNLAATLFVSFVAYILLGLQFSSATIIGFLIVGGLSLFTSIYHLHSFRNEVYYGRSFKKANVEANRKSLGLTLNSSILSILIGLVAYIFGGNLVRNLAVYLMLGAVLNILFTLTVYRGLIWLLANEVSLSKNYKVFAINEKLIPDSFNDEKQTYFGRFANVNYTKKSLSIGIGALIFALLGGGLITYLSLSGQPIIASPSNQVKTRLYFEVTKHSDIESAKYVEDNILEYLTIDGDKFSYSAVNTFDLDRTEEEVTVTYRFFVIDSQVAYKLNDVASYTHGSFTYSGDLEETLNQAVYNIDNDDSVSKVSLHVLDEVIEQPKLGQMALATALILLVGTVYLAITTKLSRALAALTTSGLSAVIIITFLAITRIASSPIAGLVMFLITSYAFLMSSFIFAKEKELISEDKSKDELSVIRSRAAVKAVGISGSSLLLISGISAYVALNYFGFGPSVMAPLYGVISLGVLVVTLLVFTLNAPISLFFAKVFSKWNLNLQLPKRKGRRWKTEASKSAEPIESIIIGIND